MSLLALAAGCGGSEHAARAPTTTAPTTTARSPLVRALVRDYKAPRHRRGSGCEPRRRRSIEGRCSARPGCGGRTARFIEDLEGSHLSPKARNREIDHAAAAVATSCEQCFQQLEAIRPIPQIAGH